MADPIQWTLKQLTDDASTSKEKFRKERIEEPIDKFLEFYEAVEPTARAFVKSVADMLDNQADLARLLDMQYGLEVYRYLTAPPISADDLATLSGVPVTKALRNNGDRQEATNTTIQLLLDPKRFPWVRDGRVATTAELRAAITATTALLAAQKVQTHRRGKARSSQEAEVKAALIAAGYTEVSGRRTIKLLSDAPPTKQFSGECMLGPTRADIVARIPDGRVLAIECKTSNSTVNSYKRINHEALGKAVKWLDDFGKAQVVPAATLQGVFASDNLQSAQKSGLFLFWQFRLSDLVQFAE
jgi:hypothetical protein